MAQRRIVFLGSPDFAVPSLDALSQSGRYRPLLVVSQPDRPRGRGRSVSPTAVRGRALELGIDTRQMDRDNYTAVVREIVALNPHAVAVVAFGIIVRRDLLDAPPLGCINVHAALLPRHRGVSPVQAAILSGEPVTGCTTIRMDEGIDTGDMLMRCEVAIDDADTAGTLTEKLAQAGAGLLVRTLDAVFGGSVVPTAQGDSPTPYTRKVRKRDGAIVWNQDAEALERRVRAMTPWPGAYILRGKRRLIVTRAVPAEGEHRQHAPPGTVVSVNPLRVACARGALEIVRVKPEGARDMSSDEFVAGHPVVEGEQFGNPG